MNQLGINHQSTHIGIAYSAIDFTDNVNGNFRLTSIAIKQADTRTIKNAGSSWRILLKADREVTTQKYVTTKGKD